MTKNLLLEIGTEELPSSCIMEALKNLKDLLTAGLCGSNINFEDVGTYATPRRIVAFARGVSVMQQSREKTVTGPPKKIAFDENGRPAHAATGFAKSLGLDAGQLVEIDTDRGVYLGYRFLEEPKPSLELLPDVLKDVISSLSFSKQMTWGNYSTRFARPIRWIAAVFGDDIVEFNIENIVSSNSTRSHRTTGNRELTIPHDLKDIGDYMNFLETSASVMLDQYGRRQKILDNIKDIEENRWGGKYKAVIDNDLIEEVVNLVEMPNVLTGSFPAEYLYIPKEILIKAIQHHQRYFAVTDKKGNVATNFITIQNGTGDKTGAIIKGNERVLAARLSDAKFFYEEDRKGSFEIWLEKLKGVVFYSGAGSLYDKAVRLEKICLEIKRLLKEGKCASGEPGLSDDLSKAARFCKCDLVTNLVVEFPELQGLVGREYAIEKGENENVSAALFEHYLPRFSGDYLPETDAGAILSIADKLDTIAGMFLSGNISSGSEDPFALRRKASGIILAALKKNYDIDVLKISKFTVDLFFNGFDFKIQDRQKNVDNIVDFIFARYRFRLEKEGKRTDIFESIRGAGYSSIIDIDLRYKALISYIEDGGDMALLAEPLIRCKNIIKGRSFGKFRTDCLKEEAEIMLYKELAGREKQVKGFISERKFRQSLAAFAGMGVFINDFFDKVLVMDKNEEVRQNRINLVKLCTDFYLLYADFSKIL